MTIRNAVFDLDGPLLDTRLRHHACYSQILRDYGFKALSAARYWELKRGGHDRRKQLAATGAAEIYDEFLSEWLRRIERPALLSLDRVQPGALEALARWRGRGTRLVLATHRRNRKGLAEQLERTGLIGFFEYVVPSAPAGGGVGKAEAVRASLPELLGETTVWIGDTEVDIDAARELQCAAWVVTCGIRSGATLHGAKPDLVAPDVRSLPYELPPLN